MNRTVPHDPETEKMTDLGIYIHIPFCVKKCNYCAFYSLETGADSALNSGECIRTGAPGVRGSAEEGRGFSVVPNSPGQSGASGAKKKERVAGPFTGAAGQIIAHCTYGTGREYEHPRFRKYIAEQAEKIRSYGPVYSEGRIVDSIFFGGGTPSILPAGLIGELLTAVKESFTVAPDAEITLESNPGTLSRDKLNAYIDMGVNRLSIGIQSLDDAVLRTLGRIHGSEEAIEAFAMARDAGFRNINTDVMFGIPGQSYVSWTDTLKKITGLAPEHISFYSLQLEEGTPLYESYRRGELPEINNELERRMYHDAISMMKAAGYEHYEISNAAKPGFRCRHNQKYWRFREYLGIGDSASSFMEGIRFKEEPEGEYHVNSFTDSASEYVFTGLRMLDGISKKAFSETFGREFRDVFGDRAGVLKTYIDKGYLIEDGDILRITEEGIDCSNDIMAEFV